MNHLNTLNISYITLNVELEKKINFFLEEWKSDGITMTVQTSGSTGTPKIFQIEKEKMRNSAQMTCDFLHLEKGNTALLCLPLEYISGKMMMVRTIIRELNLMVTEPTLTPLKNLKQKIDFCAMTPLQVENSLDKIHLVKKLIIGGAQVSESLREKIKQHLSTHLHCKVYETYGMSETLSHIALREIFPKNEVYFEPLHGVNITQDERGCLIIEAPQLNPQKLITNDIVEINEQGSFKFVGRADYIINSGGAKISPESLEKELKKILANEMCFIGVDDEVLGQKLVLVIEEKNEKRHQEIEKMVFNFPFQKSFHKPKNIVFIDEIPRTPNGKVNRRVLGGLLEP